MTEHSVEPTDLKAMHSAVLAELSSLGRVSHRLAMTEGGPPLEKVLSVLLPRLLTKIGTNHVRTVSLGKLIPDTQTLTSDDWENLETLLKIAYDKVHSKLVEMLGHTMKRVRADSNCTLPCMAILQLLYNGDERTCKPPEEMDPFTLNLSLAFLTLGVPRCTSAVVEVLLPGLIVLHGALLDAHVNNVTISAKAQYQQAGHLVLRAVEIAVNDMNAGKVSASGVTVEKHIVCHSTEIVGMDAVRLICGENYAAASGLYDLLLDALLYKPDQNSNANSSSDSVLPPPGLSSDGLSRLLAGTSTSFNNWGAEMIYPVRLREFKLAILRFVSPTQRFSAFGSPNDVGGENANGLTTARMVSLLVVGSSDYHLDIAERASGQLKSFIDSRRAVQRSNIVGNGVILESPSVLGDTLTLTCELLRLVLGGFSSCKVPVGSHHQLKSLGRLEAVQSPSRYRSLASEKTATVIFEFLAANVFDAEPRIFSGSLRTAMREKQLGALCSGALAIGPLSVASCHLYLLGPGATGFTSWGNERGTASVAGSKMLNALSATLTNYYDILVTSHFGIPSNFALRPEVNSVLILLSQILSIASSVLATASSPSQTSPFQKDARSWCYGVVCNISRSDCALAPSAFLFCGGCPRNKEHIEALSMSTQSTLVATTLAALLFGCTSNEEEALRIRAMAALDALLNAYCKVHRSQRNHTSRNESKRGHANCVIQHVHDGNPWRKSDLAENLRSQRRLDNNEAETEILSIIGVGKSLLPLLWTSAQSSQPKSSRLAAASWAKDLLRLLNLPMACHLLCYLSGDGDATVVSLAMEGLGIDKHRTNGALVCGTKTKGDTMYEFPEFNEIVRIIFCASLDSSTWRPSFKDFSVTGKASTLRFGISCLLGDFYGGDEQAVDCYVAEIFSTLLDLTKLFGLRLEGINDVHYVVSLSGASRGKDDLELLDECAICLFKCLSASLTARTKVINSTFAMTHMAIACLSILSPSSKARRYFAQCCGLLFEVASDICSAEQASFSEWAVRCEMCRFLEMCSEKVRYDAEKIFAEEIHGAAHLGAACIRAFRIASSNPLFTRNAGQSNPERAQEISFCYRKASSILVDFGRGCCQSDETIGKACADGIAVAFSHVTSDAPLLDPALGNSAAECLEHLSFSLKKYGHGDQANALRVLSLLRASGKALAATFSVANGSAKDGRLGVARRQCVDAVFGILGSAAFRKDNTIALAIGESLAEYSDAYSPAGSTWSRPQRDPTSIYDESFGAQLPPHDQTLYRLFKLEMSTNNPHKRAACAPAMLALVSHAARLASKGKERVERAFVQAILRNLLDFQTNMTALLASSKSKQFIRESCCLGLAACHAVATCSAESSLKKGLNENYLIMKLLKVFGESTNFGKSALAESAAEANARRGDAGNDSIASDEATAAFEELESNVSGAIEGGVSGMAEASLSAFKEMASVAVSLGSPTLLYTLMTLSVTHAAWSDPVYSERYSPSGVLGGVSSLAFTSLHDLRQILLPQMGKLVPKLLRACNDPNKQTRDQMNALWTAICGGGAESRSLISCHLLATVDSLNLAASSKQWRTRVGACGALSDVLVGRSWEDLGGGGPQTKDSILDLETQVFAGVRVLRLWKTTMRCMDDVRLAVRESGEALSRTMKNLTVRLCDPSDVEASNVGQSCCDGNSAEISATAAASTSLGWLMDDGLNQPCAEATGACVSCLLAIIEVARHDILEPVLPKLIGSLAVAVSGLEPAALNYLQVRVSGSSNDSSSYDDLERFRFQLAQKGPINMSLTKCLEMVRHVPLDSQRDVVFELDTAFRCAAGSSTRVAVAEGIALLCGSCPEAFQQSSQATSNILRGLYTASEREKGSMAKEKMSAALGALAAYAPGASVRSLALLACHRYSMATGSNDDPIARRAAACALRAMAVKASSQFSNGGQHDIWLRRVLPVAYLGIHDNDSGVANLWRDVWDEGRLAANISVSSLTGTDGISSENVGWLLQERLLPSIVFMCVEALNDVSWSRRRTGCSCISDLVNQNVLAPVLRNVECVIEGKRDEMRARENRRIDASCVVMSAGILVLRKKRVWSGKAELVTAIVSLACKWHGYSSCEATGSKTDCSDVLPITSDIKREDLFVGDSWFANGPPSSDDEDDVGMEAEASWEGTANCPDVESCDSEKNRHSLISSVIDQEDIINSEARRTVSYTGLCKLLLSQSMVASIGGGEILLYRAAALKGLADFLTGTESSTTHGRYLAKCVYDIVAPECLALVGGVTPLAISSTLPRSSLPPLIVAHAFECLAALMYYGIEVECEDGKQLLKIIFDSGGPLQPAWTVRESAALAGASLASKASSPSIRKMDTPKGLIDCATQASKDRKFWRVRAASMKILLCLVKRAGDRNRVGSLQGVTTTKMNSEECDRQLILEALLPHKERIVKLARVCLTDSESQVTSLASAVCSCMSWWP